jgi:hypothetical protein
MAKAPLSQTLFLTEDGSTVAVTIADAVTIPPILRPPPSFTTEPSISGTPAVGQTLTGNTGTISNGSVSAVQWLRNGAAISGATSATYVLVTADAGKAVTFRVTAIGSGGTEIATAAAVTIPAYTVANTLAGSTLLSAQVEGEPAIYAALYPRLSAVKAQILAARDRRIALTARVVVLEGGTPSTAVTPTPSSDPTYDPAMTVVVNAQRWSEFLDAVIALAASEDSAWANLLARIAALENPPIPAITITGTPPTTGRVGAAYSFIPTTANGSGAKAFTLSSGTLLGGLSFNTATGAIIGSPTVAGTMSGLVVTVTDSTGSASTTATNVTIAAAQPRAFFSDPFFSDPFFTRA